MMIVTNKGDKWKSKGDGNMCQRNIFMHEDYICIFVLRNQYEHDASTIPLVPFHYLYSIQYSQ